jgi:hypothetical protein|uniref:Uncharacterized protein n=1 Tax=Sipha flava TaxID=143950 RepID=A0A2S2QNQ8_9HEMI
MKINAGPAFRRSVWSAGEKKTHRIKHECDACRMNARATPCEHEILFPKRVLRYRVLGYLCNGDISHPSTKLLHRRITRLRGGGELVKDKILKVVFLPGSTIVL